MGQPTDIITKGEYVYQVYATGTRYTIIQTTFNGEIVSTHSEAYVTRLEAITTLQLFYKQGKLGGRLDADKN